MTFGIIGANGNAILDTQRSGGANLNAVAQMYVQAHSGDPGAAGTANVSAGDATRKAINHNAPAGASMTLSNVPTFTNGGVSETLEGISVWDSPVGGTCKYTGDTPSAPWVSGQQATLTTCTVTLTPVAA